jgi:NodT family efflux transporter outer membrane factor (OMF) lipoprotein
MKQQSPLSPYSVLRLTVMTVAIAPTALICGCSTAHISTPSVALPAAYESAAAATSVQKPQALDQWWRLFDDPQLTHLIEQALVASPDAKSALQRISEAHAVRAQTLSAYYPQGALQGSAQTQNTTESLSGLGVSTAGALGGAGGGGLSSAFITPAGDLQTYAAQFNVSYVVDLFGLQRTARRAADQDVAAARFNYEATRATLATDVATALFQTRGYAIQLADARETLRIATDLAKSGELSASRGLTSTSDSARLETDVATAKAEVDRLTAVELAARRSLLALIGRGFDSLDRLQVEAIAPPPPAAPSVAPGDLLRRRPDVREAEAQLRSASDNLALDRLALFPSFSLTPGIQLAKTGGIYALTSSIWTVGIGASEPVLDRARLLAVIRGQKARGEEAVAAYEKAVQNAYRDAENGLATFSADTKRSSDLKVAEDHARFAFEAKRRGYDLGLTDLTTLLEAERTWRQTLSAYNGARTTALVDAATLFQALGGGWSPDQSPASGKA